MKARRTTPFHPFTIAVLFPTVLFLFLVLIIPHDCTGQSDLFQIRKIEIEGTAKTHDYVIKRELAFKEGELISLHDLPALFERGKRQLDLIGIFAEAEFNLRNLSTETHEVDVLIKVSERWSIYPVPMVELADRNFNVWWTDYQHSLRRINYSLKLYYINFTGRNDELQTKVQLGFSQKYELKYRLPSFKRLPDWGFSANLLYGLENDLRYKTIQHREHFIKSEGSPLYRRFRAEGTLIYRKEIYNQFGLKIAYHQNEIAEQVHLHNPNFFGQDRLRQKYIVLGAGWRYDTRNSRIFPSTGNFLSVDIDRFGTRKTHDLNYWETTARFNHSKTLRPSLIASIEGEVRKQFTETVLPYTQRRALNWEDSFLEGYDYYLLDGTDYLTLKIGLFYKLYTQRTYLGSWMPIESYKTLNIDIIVGVLAATGYLYDNNFSVENYMVDRPLYSIGPEIKLIVNDFILGSGQIAINHLGEVGLYLRAKVAFGM